ncbi:hypothetical protein [Parahaliea maris]|nr:hypothetical protein [Parahaliea maris]
MGLALEREGSESQEDSGHPVALSPSVIPENSAIEEVIPEDAYKQNHIYRLLVKPPRKSGDSA